RQFDLFGPPRAAPDPPLWRMLPEETRRAATSLLARLILEHGCRIAVWPGRERPMTSDKIRPHHRDRKAILYVRQSSIHQVLHNGESRALQYAMRERLQALGWAEIEIIDDDLGRSAAGSVARARFARVVGEALPGAVGGGAD